jgi:F-type H+-transporting ATPase subunit epsilon
MKFQLITLLGVKLDKDVYELVMPTAAGEIGVFPGHEHLVSLAIPGAISVRYKKGDPDKDLDHFAITGGIIEVNPDFVKVLVDEAESGADIVEEETSAALERAMHLRDNAKNQVELDRAHQLIDRHAVRLKVAGLHRRHHRS